MSRAVDNSTHRQINSLRSKLTRRSFCLLALPACFAVGCASWSRQPANPDTSTPLSPPKKSPDSVVVEITRIRFPEEQAAELNQIWKVVDESAVDLNARRALAANGIRCGVLVGEMPHVIRARLKELNQPSPDNSLELLGVAADVSTNTHRLHCHAGTRKEVLLRASPVESLTVLYIDRGHFQGDTYQFATIGLDLRAAPLSDGRATIKMTPEIQHGEERKRIVTNLGAVSSRMERESRRWDDLAMQATLVPGQYLFCTVTEQPFGLGQAMFSTRTSDRTTERVLLVLRLVSGELDALFAPEEVEAARLAAERT